MSHLTIRVKVFGRKNQEFIRIVLVPKKISKKNRYISVLGYWDTKQNKKMRYIVINIYKIMHIFFFGAKPTKRVFNQLYKYFINESNPNYFTKLDNLLLIENEIKKKYK